MSLSIFLNEINKKEDSASVLECYTYFGIEQDVALESAMGTIKEKVKAMIMKIQEWITKFINWVRNIFKKKIKEVDEKTHNLNQTSPETKRDSNNNEKMADKKIHEHKSNAVNSSKTLPLTASKQLRLTAPKQAMVNSELYKIFIEATEGLHSNVPKIMEHVNSILTSTAPFNKNQTYNKRYYKYNAAVDNARGIRWSLEELRLKFNDNDEKREPFNKTQFEAVSNRLIQTVEFLNNEIKTLSNYMMTDEKAKDLGTYDDDDTVKMHNESNYKLEEAMQTYQFLIRAFNRAQQLGMYLLSNIRYE